MHIERKQIFWPQPMKCYHFDHLHIKPLPLTMPMISVAASGEDNSLDMAMSVLGDRSAMTESKDMYDDPVPLNEAL